jgi:hypothetical protein
MHSLPPQKSLQMALREMPKMTKLLPAITPEERGGWGRPKNSEAGGPSKMADREHGPGRLVPNTMGFPFPSIERHPTSKAAGIARAEPIPAHHYQTPGPGSRDKMTR